MSEKEQPKYNHAEAVEELVRRIGLGDPITDVLKDKIHKLSLIQREQSVIVTLTSETEKDNTVGALIAQSELTAIKSLQIKQEMDLEDAGDNENYKKAEEKVDGVLGSQTENLEELRQIALAVKLVD